MLYYEETGQGPALVFLHGLGSSARDWEEQVDVFSARYRVITVDLRGHGRSDKPAGPYSIPLLARDVATLMEMLGTGAAHVVGLSMGGMVAFQLALDAPERVRSLTIVNSAPDAVIRTLRQRLLVIQRKLLVRLFGMRGVGEFLARRLFLKPEHEEKRRLFVERWAANDQRAYLDTVDAVVGWSVLSRLGDLDVPTLILTADEDYIPVVVKEAYAVLLPRAELVVVPDARHALPIEWPGLFNQALDAFLTEASRRA